MRVEVPTNLRLGARKSPVLCLPVAVEPAAEVSKQRRSAEATVRTLCVRLSCDSYLTILAGREVCYVF
jgi:hypothetical protein